MEGNQKRAFALASVLPAVAVGVYMLTAAPAAEAVCNANECAWGIGCYSPGGCLALPCDSGKSQCSLVGGVPTWGDCNCSGNF
jgi:hypothetical protein